MIPSKNETLENCPNCRNIKCECPKTFGKECKHEDVKLVGAFINTHLCFKCGGNLVSNEIEIYNEFYEVGGVCDNEKCERYLILVV